MKHSKKFLNEMRENLIDRQGEILEEIRDSSSDSDDRQVMDSGDEALSLSMEKLQNALQKNEINELNSISDAINRMDKGEYGICLDCGNIISQQRLEHYPYAPRCIVCQEALESQ